MAEGLARIGAFSPHVAALPAAGGDIRVAARDGLGVATVMARPGAGIPLVAARLGIDAPSGPGVIVRDATTVVGTGPGTWLVLRDAAPSGWFDALDRNLAGVAAVAEQSSAYAVLRLGGAAGILLGKGAFLDFHPDVFVAGTAAVTLIAHLGVTLWRPDDETFGVAVFRSQAGSFWHWMETAAAGSGLVLSRSDA